jgi:hypothetical protein
MPAALHAAKGMPSGPGALSRGFAMISWKLARSVAQQRPPGTTWMNGMISSAASASMALAAKTGPQWSARRSADSSGESRGVPWVSTTAASEMRRRWDLQVAASTWSCESRVRTLGRDISPPSFVASISSSRCAAERSATSFAMPSKLPAPASPGSQILRAG